MAEPEEIEEDKVEPEPEPEPEQEIELEFEPIDDPIEAQAIEDVVVDSTGEEQLKLKASKTVPIQTTVEAPLYESEDASELATTNWRIALREALKEGSDTRRKELEAQKERGEIPVTVDIDQIIEDEINETVEKSKPNMVLAGDATGFNTSRLLKDAPTAYMYQVHEAAEMALLESEETYLDSFIGFFKGIRPEQLIDAEQLVQSRSIQYTNKELAEKLRGEGKTEEEVRVELQKKADEEGTELFEFTYTPFEEERRTYDLPGEALDFKITHEDVDIAANAAGAVLGYKQAKALGKSGAAFGEKLFKTKGRVFGGLVGGVVGYASGHTMGAMGVKILDAERHSYEGGPEADIAGARRAGQFSYDLAKGMLSAFGTVNDIADQLEVSSAEARAALISRSVAAAEAFGVADKIGDSEVLSNFIDWAKNDPNFIETVQAAAIGGTALSQLRSKRALASILSHSYASGKDKLTDLEQTAVEVALGIDTSGEKSAGQQFAEVLAEIQTELKETPEFREAANLAREEEIKDLSEQLTRARRKREPEYKDWDAIQYFEDIDLGVHNPSDKNKKLWVKSWLYEQSYNELNPDIKGEQPNVDAFIEFVKLDMAMGGKEYHGNPKIDATLEAIREGDNKAAVQQLLNSMPLRFVNQFRQSNSAGIYQMPTTDQVEKWARDNAKFLEEKVGRKSTREIQRTMQSLMLKKGGSLQYAPTLFGELLQWAALIPTVAAETDVAVDFKDFPDTLLPVVETLGLPTVVGTPAGVDLLEGLGIRNPESTLQSRIRARRKSGTGGFQVGYEELMLAKGFERGSPEFNLAQNLGFGLDMLNLEKYIGRAVGNVGRVGANAIPAGKVFMSEHPANRAALTKRRLLQNTDFDRTEDPTVANHKLLKQNAQAELNEGPNPLDRMDAAERELFSDILIATGRNPDEVFAAFQEAAQVSKYVRRQSEKITRAVDTNDIIVLKNSPEYKALLADVNDLVQAGRIKADDAARFMSMLEAQATRIADATDTPYRSAAEVLGGLRITTNRPARPGARFMGKGLEEVDETPENAFSQPLGRDNSLSRIRAIMDDLNIEETDPVFKADLEKKFGKSNLEDFSDAERLELKDRLFKAQMKVEKPAVVKVDRKKLAAEKKKYQAKTHSGVPDPLTRKNPSRKKFKEKPVPKGTNTKNAAASFEKADNHTELLDGRNPILSDEDWNQWWGGITDTKQVLRPPLKLRTYANPESLAAELNRLTPEQKKRADGGMELVEGLGNLYNTGIAEANVTAQLLAWAILSRSLSAFPHESAFLDIFLNSPPASVFQKNLDGFIRSAVEGTFDAKMMLEYDVWVGGVHRQRAADKMLADGDIDQATHTLFVGRDADTINDLLNRNVIDEDQADRFKTQLLPALADNKKANEKITETMVDARKDAAALLREEKITPDEFGKLVGFAPALRIEGAGNPAAANLRAFGKNFLSQSSEILPEGHPYAGQTKLAAWHSILLDQSISGQQARRLFHQIYQSSGIDNKVISFMLLAAGRTDVIVIDRIQANHFWGQAENLLGDGVLRRDGTQMDLYEGFSKPTSDASWKKWLKNPRPYSASRGLADVLSGGRGAILYEAIESLLLGSIDEAYRLAGREGEGSIGRLHWETWVINSGQEVGHDTLAVILKQALGYDDPAVGAYVSEGKFGMFRYGIKYAVMPDGQQTFVMATQDGVNYVFDAAAYSDFFGEIKRHKERVKVEDRVIPKGWSIQNEKFENTPWYHRASVDRDNLDKLIRRYGRRATDNENVALDRYSSGTGELRPDSGRARDAAGAESDLLNPGNKDLRRTGLGEDQTKDPVEPTVLRLVEDGDPDTRFQRKEGVPLGYFEYDQRTRKAIINLFEKGDLDTLWHENGHFMATLMGREFTDKLFRYFDNELMDDGTRSLTDLGHEQFAEAWRYYRRVRDNPNGFVRRLMDELWISLHNLWSRIRKKPGLLPNEVRQYWDLEFGEAPKDRRNVQAITNAALNKRPKYTKLRATQQERILYSPDADKARKRVAMELGFDSETMHSLLGDRKQNRIRFETDLNTGERQRVLERSYDPREYDAIDAGLEVYALIKNTAFRKSLANKPMTPVGSGRYHVPVAILKTITDKSTNRFIDALGMDPETITKQIEQPNRSGLNSLADPDTIPDGVTDVDILSYRNRFAARFFNESNEQINKRVQETGFIVLDDRAQAGLKTLIQEIGNQPEADLIPFSLLDPDVNLRLISVDEYNTIRNVVTDIVATPLNRRSRNTTHPGYLMRMASFFENREQFEGIGEALRKIAETTRKKKEISEMTTDPNMVEILDGYGRMIMNAGKSIIRLANDPELKAIDTLYDFFQYDVSLHTPRVNLSSVRSLFEIVGTLDGSIQKMEAKAAARVAEAEEAGKPIPTTYDPFDLDDAALGKMSPGGGVTLQEIGRKIALMQDLLDGPYGMTPREREAINQLRIFNERLKYAQDAAEFTTTDRATIADAIQVIHEGLREKKQYVESFSTNVFEKILAIKQATQFDLNDPLVIDIYQKFYRGDIKGLLDIGTPKKIRRAPEAQTPRQVFQYSKKLGLMGKIIEGVSRPIADQLGVKYSTKTPDLNQALMALMIMLKVDDVRFGLARELAENGYDLSRRSITNNLDLKGEINISRSKYVDRVLFYIDRTLSKSDEVAGFSDLQFGRKVRIAQKPVKDMYGPTEKPSAKRPDSDVITRIDKSAQYEADQILKRAGIRIDDGTAEIIMIGDKQFIMPKNMVDQLESWAQETYPNARFKKTWGRTGRAEYQLELKDASTQNSQRIKEQIANAALVWQRAAEFLVSPRTFYTGLLIGVGGLPMVGYGMGVFIGGLSQVHLGQGVLAATQDLLEAPGTGARVASEVTPLVRNIAEAADVEIQFVAGTLARLFGDGSHRPRTKPLVLPDGRIITADMLANTVDRYGWKSAFADALASNNLYDQFYERFTQANPTWINGAMFGLIGAPLGPQSALLSAAFGMSMAQSLKPGNIFSKAHRFYRESFVAIDTYMRIKVLVRELKAGATLDDAAKKTRKIMLDYSDLSDAEASYFKRYFAFYTYFSQANKLLFTSLLENPDRVITQLKFARNTQLKATESKDPDLMLSPWDRYRSFLPFEIMGQRFRLPFLLTGDSVGLLLELFLALPFTGGDESSRAARLGVFSRLAPQLGLGAAVTFGIDPGLGFPLERATLQVPAELVEFDLEFTGGTLHDILGIEYIEPENIRFVWDDKEKRRVNERNIEMPGRGIFVAKNTKAYLFLMEYLQTPVTGRMGDNLWALSRANAGVVEGLMDLTHALKSLNPDKPILSNIGALQVLGFVKEKDIRVSVPDDAGIAQAYVSPTEPGLAKDGAKEAVKRADQITTASIPTLRKYGVAYKSKDGSTYNVYADQFYPTEIGRTIGFSAWHPQTWKKLAYWKYKQHAKKSAEAIRRNEAQQRILERTAPIDNEQ